MVDRAGKYGAGVPLDKAKRLFGKENVTEWVEEKGWKVSRGLIVDKGVDEKEARQKYKASEEKIEYAREKLKMLRWIPWLRFVGISGSVAFRSANEEDDIDVFVVAARNRLWLVRGIESVLLSLMRVRRRYGDEQLKNKICVNYYVSEADLDLKKGMEDTFRAALELVSLEPVVGKWYMSVLILKNEWVGKYFTEVKASSTIKVESKRIPIVSGLFDMLDSMAMRMQVYYMKVRRHSKGTCDISLDRAVFW